MTYILRKKFDKRFASSGKSAKKRTPKAVYLTFGVQFFFQVRDYYSSYMEFHQVGSSLR